MLFAAAEVAVAAELVAAELVAAELVAAVAAAGAAAAAHAGDGAACAKLSPIVAKVRVAPRPPVSPWPLTLTLTRPPRSKRHPVTVTAAQDPGSQACAWSMLHTRAYRPPRGPPWRALPLHEQTRSKSNAGIWWSSDMMAPTGFGGKP